ncbi:MAG: hypothetical protein F6K55_18735 [Moorea sp. SIO4A3]|nr:hypothetical protein [Moorena sp. SIO4A3]
MSDCIKTEKLCSSSNKISRIPPLTTIPGSRLDAVAHGGNHGNSEWFVREASPKAIVTVR